MNAFEHIQENHDSSLKSHKGKLMSGAKERATKRYFKEHASHIRRKQAKASYDTHRRYEEPTIEDQKLDDIHLANFTGYHDYELSCRIFKELYGDTINLNMGDMFKYQEPIQRKEDQDQGEDEGNQREDEGNQGKGSQGKGSQGEEIATDLAALVEYMKKQVKLAEEIITDELYVCDCKRELCALPCN
jgi:hypothetical protein